MPFLQESILKEAGLAWFTAKVVVDDGPNVREILSVFDYALVEIRERQVRSYLIEE